MCHQGPLCPTLCPSLHPVHGGARVSGAGIGAGTWREAALRHAKLFTCKTQLLLFCGRLYHPLILDHPGVAESRGRPVESVCVFPYCELKPFIPVDASAPHHCSSRGCPSTHISMPCLALLHFRSLLLLWHFSSWRGPGYDQRAQAHDFSVIHDSSPLIGVEKFSSSSPTPSFKWESLKAVGLSFPTSPCQGLKFSYPHNPRDHPSPGTATATRKIPPEWSS